MFLLISTSLVSSPVTQGNENPCPWKAQMIIIAHEVSASHAFKLQTYIDAEAKDATTWGCGHHERGKIWQAFNYEWEMKGIRHNCSLFLRSWNFKLSDTSSETKKRFFNTSSFYTVKTTSLRMFGVPSIQMGPKPHCPLCCSWEKN